MTAAPKKAPEAIDPRNYPAIREAFRGYLHEDWTTEYADSADAVRAFRRDAGAEEAKAVAVEAKKLLGAGFGSGWRPSTAAEADRVLRFLAGE